VKKPVSPPVEYAVPELPAPAEGGRYLVHPDGRRERVEQTEPAAPRGRRDAPLPAPGPAATETKE
jgi:hypothetical protein